MILINIESLSDNELRNIAQQEDLEDWESLSREELIEGLEELYGEDDELLDGNSANSKKKYVNTLTDVQSDNVLSLPGVERLPESYNDTSVHMVLKDPDWAFVFWSISPQQLSELEESGAGLILRNTRLDGNDAPVAEYDIDITSADTSWTVELPYAGFRYRVSLVAVSGEKESVICTSNTLETSESWFATHADALEDGAVFRSVFSSLIMKGGTVIPNRQLLSLVEKMQSAQKQEADAR